MGTALTTSSRAWKTGPRSSVKGRSCSRPWSIRKTPTARPWTAGRFTHSRAASQAVRRATGESRSKTRASTASLSTSGAGGAGAAASGDATGGGEAEVPATTLPCASSTADVLTSWKSATSCRTPSSSTSTSEGRRSRTIRPFLSRTTKSTATSAAVTGMTGGAAGACAPPVGGTATATARTKASVRKVDPPAPRDAPAEMLPDRGARIRPVPQGAIVTFAQRTALSTPSATVTRSS